MAVRPLLRDFMGLNTHTVQFRPELYRPVTRLLRDYHGMDWDIGNDTTYTPQFPMSRNGVNWQELYGAWTKAGYEIDVSVMLGQTPPSAWKDLKRDAFGYAQAFARYFGPSGGQKLVTSVEIGNEPGNYPDSDYRALFENMAKGFRAGDPRLKVVTGAMFDRPSGEYHKALATVRGLEPLYDVINVHSYAQVEGWPTWRRSYPEDPATPYLKDIRDVARWRDAHARGKAIWLTEFGYDSSTQPNAREGTFKDWIGVTDTQQARYIVRSFLVFSAMPIDRAYLYWFNDDDKPQVHAAAGLTRHYQPKPSFHAVAHLLGTLGDYRFQRVVRATPGEAFVYEYRHGADPRRFLWAAWSPTGKERKADLLLGNLPGKVEKAERMPLAPGKPERITGIDAGKGTIRVPLDESVLYLFMRA